MSEEHLTEERVCAAERLNARGESVFVTVKFRADSTYTPARIVGLGASPGTAKVTYMAPGTGLRTVCVPFERTWLGESALERLESELGAICAPLP